jgi:hypothetical protein
VEVLPDVALRVLPVAPAEMGRMLTELKCTKMLARQRGLPAADLDAVALTIPRIGDAAMALGAALKALDINSLWFRRAPLWRNWTALRWPARRVRRHGGRDPCARRAYADEGVFDRA